MEDTDLLAERFETHRSHLRAVALRMTGSTQEADDAVQEAWIRLSRSDAGAVDNLGGWLTTVVARVCLDLLRARSARREDPLDGWPDPRATTSPEDEVLLADSIGLAMLVVLDALSPAERLAFVLHDLFAVPFEEIAPIVGRTPTATRKLASRARHRVQSDPQIPEARAETQQRVVAAFLAAARGGEFAGLIELLDPEVVVRADPVAVDSAAKRAGAGAPALSAEMRGVDAVTRVFAGGARAARLVLVDGLAGAVVAVGGRPMAVFEFVVRDGLVVGIDLLADPGTLEAIELERIRA